MTSIVCQDQNIVDNRGKCQLGESLADGVNLDGYGLGVEWRYNPYLKIRYWWHSGTNAGGYHNTFSYIPQSNFAITIFAGLNDKSSDDYDHFRLVSQVYDYFYPK